MNSGKFALIAVAGVASGLLIANHAKQSPLKVSLETEKLSESPAKTFSPLPALPIPKHNHSPTVSQSHVLPAAGTAPIKSNSFYKAEAPKPVTQKNQDYLSKRLKPNEVQAITTYLREIRRSIGQPMASENLYRELEGLGLNPRKATNVSESTGELTTIRARKALPGTRYFHAQFMSDGDGAPAVAQHISFEIRPSADGMSIARQMAKEMFALNIEPTIDTANYVEWNKNGRTLWIERITDKKDLKDDLFNARTDDDLGMVMVALELDPHANEKP